MNRTTDVVQVYRRADGLWAWRRLAPNNRVIATDGGQGYEHKTEAIEMADRSNHDVAQVEIIETLDD